jgi:hypothetical protein
VRYAQKQYEMGFFINMTTVLPPSGLVGGPPGPSSVSGGHCRDRIPGETPQNWRDRGIIPDKVCWVVSSNPFEVRRSVPGPVAGLRTLKVEDRGTIPDQWSLLGGHAD